MTEVAQIAAVVAHDMDDATNESELNISDAENKEDHTTHEEDDVVVDEQDDDAAEEKSETSHIENKAPYHKNEEESIETDNKTHMNGVDHKEKDTADEKNKRSEDVNGEEQDTETKEDAEPDTNKDQIISDLALKKEVSEEFKITSAEIHFCGQCDSWPYGYFPSQRPRTPAAQIIVPLSLLNHRNSSDPESRWLEATCQT